ncbi:stressosome-associated protein Prli42 [Paenibacillus sp. MZ04-78.2]|nr:stressosome-associated protein Prli42 [Paenibacillus sp. MZ04-78.2]MCP3772547.1 stressosome-associated protein Prli42 [Paenibacillus sp. MZ04-78.2]
MRNKWIFKIIVYTMIISMLLSTLLFTVSNFF